MMYDATWADDKQTLVYLAFEGVWQMDEFADAQHTLNELFNEVGHEVAVVFHLKQPQPITMDMVPQLRDLLAIEHPNCAQMVLVAPDIFLGGVREVVRRAFGGQHPAHLHFTASLDDVDRLLNGDT
jgi:hypothetical protein